MEGATIMENMFYEKVLIDAERGVYTENWSISGKELDIGGEWRIEKKRLHGGLSDGVDIITVNNGPLSFVVVPTRGMGIWKGEYRGTYLGWESPIKNLVHPWYVDLEARGGIGWLDGFNEMVVRCGLCSFGAPGRDVITDNMGRKLEVPLTLHGRIANIPAEAVKVRIGLRPPFNLEVEGIVYERSMFGSNLKLTSRISTAVGSNSFMISDAVENLRGVPDEMQLLYHCNFGRPFLEDGARFVAPIRKIAPRDPVAAEEIDSFDRFGPPESGFVEKVYFMELIPDEKGCALAVLTNRAGDKAVSLRYPVKSLPCFTLWKNTSSIEDGYVTGLEPGTSFPNPKTFEREHGRVILLKPGEMYHSSVTISVHLGRNNVQKVLESVEKIRKGASPKVFKKPLEAFSPVQ
jgi:hypothetical protein